jgi:hypothetical protein
VELRLYLVAPRECVSRSFLVDFSRTHLRKEQSRMSTTISEKEQASTDNLDLMLAVLPEPIRALSLAPQYGIAH